MTATDYDWPDLGCARTEPDDARAILEQVRGMARAWAAGPSDRVSAQRGWDLLKLLGDTEFQWPSTPAGYLTMRDELLSPWEPTLARDGTRALWVMLDSASLDWAPFGTHEFWPGQPADHRWDCRCDPCQDDAPRPLICVKAFHWLRWTQVELTDTALFRDEQTGIEWEVTRIVTAEHADRAATDLPRRITYTGRPVVMSHRPHRLVRD